MWYSLTGRIVSIGLLYAGDMSAGDRLATDAEIAAWQAAQSAASSKQFTFLQFMDLFTPAEQTAIVGSADTKVKLFLLMAAGATYISLNDPQMIVAFAYLVTLGLLTADREAAILASPVPAA